MSIETLNKNDNKILDQIRGSLIGGAAGDALGYTVEFWQEDKIHAVYGSEGITNYELVKGKARISDDTQMTLFTANGLLFGATRGYLRDIAAAPSNYVAYAYADWLKTQNRFPKGKTGYPGIQTTWLLNVKELYSLRAPGNTCLSSLVQRCMDGFPGEYIENPVNHSKGCGGIMRIAPLPLFYRLGDNYYSRIETLDMEAAQIAAITHGHSLGYMPAAFVSHVISRIISTKDQMPLKDIILEARDTMEELFEGDAYLPKMTALVNKAVQLALMGQDNDLENIHMLGEGWVAEETLAIALYCALKYENDFSKALIVSVNHKGDSDSTGAVTGNILGALHGYKAMDERWKKNLELSDVILEIANDLYTGCALPDFSKEEVDCWYAKYVDMANHR